MNEARLGHPGRPDVQFAEVFQSLESEQPRVIQLGVSQVELPQVLQPFEVNQAAPFHRGVAVQGQARQFGHAFQVSQPGVRDLVERRRQVLHFRQSGQMSQVGVLDPGRGKAQGVELAEGLQLGQALAGCFRPGEIEIGQLAQRRQAGHSGVGHFGAPLEG